MLQRSPSSGASDADRTWDLAFPGRDTRAAGGDAFAGGLAAFTLAETAAGETNPQILSGSDFDGGLVTPLKRGFS